VTIMEKILLRESSVIIATPKAHQDAFPPTTKRLPFASGILAL